MSTFDVIVVGGGTAGATLAARLSEQQDRTVMLLEAGPDYGGPEQLPEQLRDVYRPVVDNHDWNLEARFVGERVGVLNRGKVLGGSSATNGAAAMRPLAADFDAWAEVSPGWSYAQLLPALRRLERDADFGDLDYHGDTGPIPVCRWNETELAAAQRGFRDACLDVGHTACPDFNAPDAHGVGSWPMNRRGRHRVSAADAYLNPARDRPNLTIRSGCHVDRVLLRDGRACGVELRVGASVPEVVHAREVVVCAGVPMSPALLLRSGIGPADELRAAGIEPLIDLAGVGRNVRDQPGVMIPAVPTAGRAALDGPTLQMALRAPLAEAAGNPDMFVSLFSALDLDRAPAMRAIVGESVATMVLVGDLTPRSTGTVRLRDADPSSPPLVDLGFYTDERDLDRMRAAVRHGWGIASQPALAPHVSRFVMITDEIVGDDAALEGYIRASTSSRYSPLGGCTMGARSDPGAVVDDLCRVHGVDGLRVCDASVVPVPLHAGPALTCIAIAEHLAPQMG